MKVKKIADYPLGILTDGYKHKVIHKPPRTFGELKGIAHIVFGIILVNGIKYREGEVITLSDNETIKFEVVAEVLIENFYKEANDGNARKASDDTFERTGNNPVHSDKRSNRQRR